MSWPGWRCFTTPLSVQDLRFYGVSASVPNYLTARHKKLQNYIPMLPTLEEEDVMTASEKHHVRGEPLHEPTLEPAAQLPHSKTKKRGHRRHRRSSCLSSTPLAAPPLLVDCHSGPYIANPCTLVVDGYFIAPGGSAHSIGVSCRSN